MTTFSEMTLELKATAATGSKGQKFLKELNKHYRVAGWVWCFDGLLHQIEFRRIKDVGAHVAMASSVSINNNGDLFENGGPIPVHVAFVVSCAYLGVPLPQDWESAHTKTAPPLDPVVEYGRPR